MSDQEMLQHCIDECLNCHSVCLQTIQHCLQKGGRHALPAHIRTMMDCAAICSTSADFMLRQSEMHHHVCGVCAEACDKCAESCGNVNDSAAMQRCIDACHSCAVSCHRMAGAAA